MWPRFLISSSEAAHAASTRSVDVSAATTSPMTRANRDVRNTDTLGVILAPSRPILRWREPLDRGPTALADVGSLSLVQLQSGRFLGERPHARRGLSHRDERRFPDLLVGDTGLLRAREASAASGQSAGHQRARVRQQRVRLAIQGAR